MWVVYSLNPETDLKVGDYRRRLIEHALDPEAWERELLQRMARVDPRSKIFEGTVLRRLMERGYNVLPQHQVGAYCIDMIVIGSGRRLAIECDGEQFHGPEKLKEDVERQAILERLGWKFVRIRGSLFFRDEARAMEAVFRRLDELGIDPEVTSKPIPEIPEDGTVSRLIRRAQELRHVWRSDI
jgi:very-short-patch-repair endonuclease